MICSRCGVPGGQITPSAGKRRGPSQMLLVTGASLWLSLSLLPSRLRPRRE